MDWEEYKAKYGPTMEEMDERERMGTISAVERSPMDLYGLPSALSQAKAMLTGEMEYVPSGLETPVFTEPIKDWLSNVPIMGAGVASGFIPGTRGDVIGETVPLAAGSLGGLALQPGGVAGQLAGVVRGGSHPTWTQRFKNLGEEVLESVLIPGGKRPTAPVPSGVGGTVGRAARRIPPPRGRRAVPKAEPGSWKRAAEDLAEGFGRANRPNTEGSLGQMVQNTAYNIGSNFIDPILSYFGED
jgi:hypothetical protein